MKSTKIISILFAISVLFNVGLALKMHNLDTEMQGAYNDLVRTQSVVASLQNTNSYCIELLAAQTGLENIIELASEKQKLTAEFMGVDPSRLALKMDDIFHRRALEILKNKDRYE